MKKSDKKIDNTLRQALTQACDLALEDINGFKWLTHTVNYNAFPASLSIVCVFDSNESLSKAIALHQDKYLRDVLQHQVSNIGIKLKNLHQHIKFDTEENCDNEHSGNWAQRIG
jgi:hypothetical protein